MKRTIGTILFIAYAIIAISVTVLLLSYNNYNCSVLGPYTFYIVKDDTLEPDYNIGDLLVIKSSSDKNIKEGDSLFFYDVITSDEFVLNHNKLVSKTQSSRRISYLLSDGSNFDSSYLIGKEEDTAVIHGIGAVLGVLESRWGYLFFVVIVSLLLFLQELFELVAELRQNKNKK